MICWLVKDLLINVIPPEEEGLDTTERLPYWMAGCTATGQTGHHLALYLYRWPWLCPGASVVGQAGSSFHNDPASMALLLSNLKKQLNSALKEMDREEQVAGSRFGPAATEKVGEVQAQMRSALDEIDREQQTIGETLRPQTIEQVEVLEAKLEQAQAELKRLKSELK